MPQWQKRSFSWESPLWAVGEKQEGTKRKAQGVRIAAIRGLCQIGLAYYFLIILIKHYCFITVLTIACCACHTPLVNSFTELHSWNGLFSVGCKITYFTLVFIYPSLVCWERFLFLATRARWHQEYIVCKYFTLGYLPSDVYVGTKALSRIPELCDSPKDILARGKDKMASLPFQRHPVEADWLSRWVIPQY